jgi:hypothetical protein
VGTQIEAGIVCCEIESPEACVRDRSEGGSNLCAELYGLLEWVRCQEGCAHGHLEKEASARLWVEDPAHVTVLKAHPRSRARTFESEGELAESQRCRPSLVRQRLALRNLV